MRWAAWGTALSASVHFLIAGATTRIPKDVGKHTTTVAVVNAKPKDKPKPKHDDPEPAPEPKTEVKAPRQAAKKAAAEPASSPAANTPAKAESPSAGAAFDGPALPDFGLSMSGGSGGLALASGGGSAGGGSAGAHGGSASNMAAKAAGPKPKGDDGGCSEDAVKPKPQGAVQPTYTDDARAAGIEGRVRVSVTVDATGKVTDAKVLAGLGHGLDQSAALAAKRMKFTPGSRCGRPVEATFVISMRFVLGE